MSALIEFDEVCKYYQMGDTTVKAADHITMKIDKGEFVAIVGCLLYTSPSPRDRTRARMPSSA